MRIVLRTPSRRPRLLQRRRFLGLLRDAAGRLRLERALGCGRHGILQVVLVGPRRMAQMNRLFLGHRGVTDVLAFALEAGAVAAAGTVVAEVYLCPAVAATAAPRFGTSLGEECLLYAVHGMLHLAGHDDHQPAARRAMRRAERRVLRQVCANADCGAIFGGYSEGMTGASDPSAFR